jgi:uncharacterized protein YjbJ (UPF0337 family)
MSAGDRVKATIQKTKEGSVENFGAATSGPDTEPEVKAKQVLDKTRDGLEDAKDAIADKAKQVADKVHDGVENIKDRLKS